MRCNFLLWNRSFPQEGLHFLQVANLAKFLFVFFATLKHRIDMSPRKARIIKIKKIYAKFDYFFYTV